MHFQTCRAFKWIQYRLGFRSNLFLFSFFEYVLFPFAFYSVSTSPKRMNFSFVRCPLRFKPRARHDSVVILLFFSFFSSRSIGYVFLLVLRFLLLFFFFSIILLPCTTDFHPKIVLFGYCWTRFVPHVSFHDAGFHCIFLRLGFFICFWSSIYHVMD